MSNEEVLKKFPAPLFDEYKLESINDVNHKPHPYCITPRHLTGEGMCLDEAAIKTAEKDHGARCGMYVSSDGKQTHNGPKSGYSRCQVPYDEHTSDKVLFVKALVNKEIKALRGINNYLKSLTPLMEKYKIDGVAFIAPTKKKKNV